MRLKEYIDSSKIKEPILRELVDLEIECWGSAPFDEYKICTKSDCKVLFSIQDIYGDIENYRKREEEKEFCCTECTSSTEFVYEKESFLDVVKDYIKGEVSSILLFDDNDNLEGFGILTKTTLKSAINYELSTRPSSFDKNDILKELSNNIFGIKDASNKEVIILHQIFVSEFIRGGGNGKKILNALLKNNRYKNIPFILETRFDSEFYPISKSMGFNNIAKDKHGYVLQYNNKQPFINLEDITKLFTEISNNFQFYKKEALLILDMNPELSLRKTYA